MMKELRINFTDFYPAFNKTDNYFFHILRSKYSVIVDEVNPDYLIYSCFGHDFLKYDCIRIFYTGENIIPDFNLCDYAIGFAHLNFEDRYIRIPNFVTYGVQDILETIENEKSVSKEKDKFCTYIYSNANADPNRDRFYHLLSKYKHIDSAGKHLNNKNLPISKKGWTGDKIGFMSDYKFSIAFENSSLSGYTTEKIIHAFMAGTIPIYWGDPKITDDFNPNAFINCHAFKNFEEVVNKVIEIDNDDQLYKHMKNQPVFNNNVPCYMKNDYLLSFLRNVLDQPMDKAGRRTKYGQSLFYEKHYLNLLGQAEASSNLPRNLHRIVKSVLRKFNHWRDK